jgi:hypothetical protein
VSIFKKKDRPRFGVTDAPLVDAAVAERGYHFDRTIDPRAYGFVPRAQIRTDVGRPDPELDAMRAAAGRGDWTVVRDAFYATGRRWERRDELTRLMGEHAETNEAWLHAWLAAEPNNPSAICVHAAQLVEVAWALRGGAWRPSQEQADGFHRVLGQVPAVVARATEIAPDDPTPFVRMIGVAMGLGITGADFDAIWQNITRRAPHLFGAHLAAFRYWLPRWRGTPVRLAEFIESSIATAPPGSLLTMLRLDWIAEERVPDDRDERREFLRGPEVGAAINACLADLVAGDPGHPRIARMRSLLAYFLSVAGRYTEAYEQFRIVGGYAYGMPWENFDDQTAVFVRYRADAAIGALTPSA